MNFIDPACWLGVAGVVAITGAAACGSSYSPSYPSSPAVTSPATTETSDGASGNVTLTVLNFVSWCSVSINGQTASSATSVTASVAPGSTATIVATPAGSEFHIGANPWFGVTQDEGGAAPGTDDGTGATETSTASVVVTGNQCVSVCCQEPNNSPTPCPATNPCP